MEQEKVEDLRRALEGAWQVLSEFLDSVRNVLSAIRSAAQKLLKLIANWWHNLFERQRPQKHPDPLSLARVRSAITHLPNTLEFLQ